MDFRPGFKKPRDFESDIVLLGGVSKNPVDICCNKRQTKLVNADLQEGITKHLWMDTRRTSGDIVVQDDRVERVLFLLWRTVFCLSSWGNNGECSSFTDCGELFQQGSELRYLELSACERVQPPSQQCRSLAKHTQSFRQRLAARCLTVDRARNEQQRQAGNLPRLLSCGQCSLCL